MEKRRKLLFALVSVSIMILAVFPVIHVVNAQTFVRVGALTLNRGENVTSTAVIDSARGFAYFGMRSWPGVVVKVRLSDFTRAGALNLNPGENQVESAAIDSGAGFAYFGTSGPPGVVVKVRLSDFTRVGSLTLNAGENNPESLLIDSATGFAYIGISTYPVTVVRVRLSDFARVGTLTFDTGENGGRLPSVIDPAAGFAYYGTEPITTDQGGAVVKVRLSDLARVGSLILNPGENPLGTSVINPVAGFAYFGIACYRPFTSLGVVAKVKLSDLSRVGTLTFNSGENCAFSSVIDPDAGFAYFGTYTFPGIVVKLEIAPHPVRPDTFGLLALFIGLASTITIVTAWRTIRAQRVTAGHQSCRILS